MGMFNFVLDSIKGEIFDFKVKRRVLVASTVNVKVFLCTIMKNGSPPQENTGCPTIGVPKVKLSFSLIFKG